MPDDRPGRPGRYQERAGPPTGPRPFRPGPRPEPAPQPLHTVRVRDGEREIEVSGSPAFVRQVLDDLQNIWAQLHGEAPRRPQSIRMPSPPEREETLAGIASDDSAG